MSYEIRQGDCLELLRQMPAGSVRCCVTSPPYWGLRDYGTATWEGGDSACKHAGRPKPRQDTNGETGVEHGRFKATRGTQPGKAASVIPVRDVCRCGARRIDAQIGLERTPEEYVARLVEMFREVRRVLADDGTLWLNMGDGYANDMKWGGSSGGKHVSALHGQSGVGRGKRETGLKPKDLVGMPWRTAFALQADGWWLRSEIVWSKPNPMPESAKDRPTRSHEQVFILSKSARYFYDYAGGSEPTTGRAHPRGKEGSPFDNFPSGWDDHSRSHRLKLGRYRSGNKARKSRGEHGGVAEDLHRGHQAFAVPWDDNGSRNRRTVWTIPTQPFAGAHFATFPEALVEPCILAGSAPGDLVLDPFAGSGTVGVVSLRYGRRFIGCELNPEYVEMGRRRIAGPLFAGARP